MLLAYLAFALAILLTHSALRLPGTELFAAQVTAADEAPAATPALAGVRPDDGQDDAAALQALLDRQPPGPVVLRLPAGVLDFMQPLVIRRDGVTVVGAGRERTRIVSHLKAPAAAVIRVEGEQGAKAGTLSQALGPQDTLLRTSVTAAPGTLLLVREPNDDAFLKAIGSERWNREYPYLRQALLKVAGSQDGGLRLADAPGVAFDAGRGEVTKVRPVRGAHLSDFSIEQRVDGKAIASVQHVYENVLPEAAVDGISLLWTQDAVIERVAVINAGRHPVSFEQSYGFALKDCVLDGAWNKGDGGSGYLRIARSYHGTVEGCTVRGIRHIALQWSSAFNRIRNVDSQVDVNFHGGYSHDNTVENVRFAIPAQHKWGPVFVTPNDAHWAPPDGPRNLVSGQEANKVLAARGASPAR
jgi:glycosyltransferase Alg8